MHEISIQTPLLCGSNNAAVPNSSAGDDVDVAKEGIRILRKKGVICSGICVGTETRKYSIYMRDIFGDEFEICDNFTEVDEFLRTKITKQVTHSLKAVMHI